MELKRQKLIYKKVMKIKYNLVVALIKKQQQVSVIWTILIASMKERILVKIF